MQRKWMLLFTALVLFSLMLSPIGTASAQDPLPPTPTPTPVSEPPIPGDEGGPQRGPDGVWYMPEGASLNPEQPENGTLAANALAPSAPDDFGYTWDDTVALNWIDTTLGANTWMSGDSDNLAIGPVPLPFSFKYYENSYSNLYIAASGYLSFTNNNGYWPWQGQIPSSSSPNNVIAPYWSPFNIGAGSWVHYMSGGSAPNRYFVVEWHDMTFNRGNFRFEAILHENGDIIFQYQTMIRSNACGASGIEDSTGLDGLTYKNWCDDAPSSNTAVRFYRPAPAARVVMSPLYNGSFLSPSASADYSITLRNTGDLGADTYDLTVVSTWPVSLYASDGTTLLTDTDLDGVVDSGSIPQGGQVTVIARVQAPASAVLGDSNTALVTARSSVNTSISKNATLQSSIPASFAQVYMDNADGAMSLDLIRPGGQERVEAAPAGQYGYAPAVASAPGWNLVYAWHKGRSTGSYWVDEIIYDLVDRAGNIVHPASKLADLSGSTMYAYDYQPALATAPDGNTGVLWIRYYNNVTQQYNYNIYFAILNPSGDVIYGPANLTNNTAWGAWNALDMPTLGSPHITATDDNRFVLAWESSHTEAGGSVNDINYTVLDMLGGVIAPITNLTNDTPGDSTSYRSPVLTALTSSRALLSWLSLTNDGAHIHYIILGSDGGIVKADTDLSVDGVAWNNWDAIQLPSGKILAVWENYGCPGEWTSRLRYVLLDGSYNRIGTPQCMPKAPGATGESNASATVGGVDDGIITWQDSQHNYLYYALVHGDGMVLTGPVIFQRSQASSPYIVTSNIGLGNAAYADTFTDVAYNYWAQDWINRLYAAGITTGCSTNPLVYCPEASVTRAEMAVFLERGIHGAGYTPPAAVGVFADFPTTYWAANWIEHLYVDGITTGCNTSPLNYCPEASVTRAEMAVFLLRAEHGAAYTPPAAVGAFADFPLTYWAANWIEQLYVEGITTGCSSSPLNYCPEASVTRAEMAVFLVRTFHLP